MIHIVDYYLQKVGIDLYTFGLVKQIEIEWTKFVILDAQS
jgi:hypothetical protein